MSSINVTTTYPTGGTLLPNAFVDYYMIKANGEYVKVYIYLLRMVSNGQKFNISCLADLLELTERDICRALKYWKKKISWTWSWMAERSVPSNCSPFPRP